MRLSVEPRLERFLGVQSHFDLVTSSGVSQFLQHAAGPLGVGEVARRVGKSRFIVSRWVAGRTDIRLPDLLRFIDVTTLRPFDFLSVFVDPRRLPSAVRKWDMLEAARHAAYGVPWSHAVLRCLELQDYRRCPKPSEEWIGERLGISADKVREALAVLKKSGQVRRRGARYYSSASKVVDTGANLERRKSLRVFWSRVAVDRLERDDEGVHSFNLFAIAESDIPKVVRMHTELFERIRALVADSDPSERVVLYSAQIVALDKPAR